MEGCDQCQRIKNTVKISTGKLRLNAVPGKL